MPPAACSETLGALALDFFTQTDAEGRLTMGGLIPDLAYELTVREERGGTREELLKRRFTPEAGVETHLGDLAVDG